MENKLLEDLIALRINNVYGEKFDFDSTQYMHIAIEFGGLFLHLKVNDVDEIIYEITDSINITGFEKPLWSDKLINKQLVQVWDAKNEKGYSDLICLGLDEAIPTIVFSSIGCEIEVGFVNYTTN